MEMEGNKRKEKLLQAAFLLILLLYPLRHITWGLDLWDTGYNYANFQYMGLEHMDPMWLFSTYFANVAGNFLTKLPFADGLVGMNFYTGLFVSLLAVTGYLFCTKKLGMKPWIVFLGEMMAVSLCWCPTALLYNYLTYVFFLFCVILLYQGLCGKKMWCLSAAGVCLGINVFVRFSNLPEAAMIVAVWAYAVIEGRENRRGGGIKQAFFHTLWCLGGYLAALVVFGGYIHLRYGMDAYIAGIQRLFGMTENAPDYKAAAMLMKLFGTYVENLYWAYRIGVIAAAGLAFFAAVRVFTEKVFFVKERKALAKAVTVASRLVWVLASLGMLGWLYYRGFCVPVFYSYGSILRPGILFLMLTMLIALIRIFHKSCPKQEKLISGMVLLVVLLTSIGSNNGVYPSLNNLFIAAPYTFWQCYLFFTRAKEYRPDVRGLRWLVISAFPVKGLLAAFLAMFVLQTTFFGVFFTFAEATGVQDVTEKVENNEILKGVGMSSEKAEWLTEISAYVEENGLKGKEVILYGDIPALSYYLQMPSAFNPWSDLDSYDIETMKEALGQVEAEVRAGAERPVMIVENQYAQYELGGQEALVEMGTAEKRVQEILSDEKWKALTEFRTSLNYEQTFSNEKFTVWE